MKTVFVLFESDVFKTKSSRVLLGVFSTKKLAEIFAKKERVESSISCAEIIEVEINSVSSF